MLRRLKRLAWGHSPDIETLSERLDGRLSPERQAEVDAHAASCDVCESALAEMREARTLLSALPTVEPPRSFRLRVADVEAAAPVRAHVGSSMMRWAPALSGAAVTVLVATIGFSMFSSGGGSAQLAATQADAPTGSLAAEQAVSTGQPTFYRAMQATPGSAAGAIAPDAVDPTPLIARSSTTTTPGEGAGGGTAESAAGAQPDVAPSVTAEAVAPALESTDDAAAAGDSGVAEDGGDGGAESFAPPPAPATTAPVGVAPEVPADEDQSDAVEKLESSDDDGNPDALLIVQIAAAVVAIAAAAGYVAWRVTRGGVAG